MPDEDLSRQFAEKYLHPRSLNPQYERVWGRWDMSAVKKAQPVIPDCEVSIEDTDVFRIMETYNLAQQSPDWWRQIGTLIFVPGEKKPIAGAFNTHYPSPYDLGICGDMRIYVDAGDSSAKELYSSLHAERVVISRCGRKGIALEGSSMYINTFPCGDCARWIVEAGIKELFFCEGYSILGGFETLKTYGVRIVQVKTPVIS
jgi:dCMP deaminase